LKNFVASTDNSSIFVLSNSNVSIFKNFTKMIKILRW